MSQSDDEGHSDKQSMDDLTHIARLDPDTIRAYHARIRVAEERYKLANEANYEASRKIAILEERAVKAEAQRDKAETLCSEWRERCNRLEADAARLAQAEERAAKAEMAVENMISLAAAAVEAERAACEAVVREENKIAPLSKIDRIADAIAARKPK